MEVGADAHAKALLTSSFPPMGPWTAAALWHGRGEPAAVPASPLAAELDEIVAQRLAGLLLRYARDAGVRLEPGEREVLQRASFSWTSAAALAAASGAAALESLRAAGVSGVVSKGPGIARLYPGLECRPYADVDVLVAPGDFARSVQVLEGQGWAEEDRNLQPWAYFRRACREGVNLRRDEAGSVDVHHRFPPWIWTDRLPVADVAARAQEVSAAGETFACLAPADNLMVAALHLISDRNAPGRTLMVWRDVVQLAAAVPVDEAVRTARAGGLAGWLRALLLALPEPVRPHELVRALPDDPIPHARRLALLLSPRSAGFGVLASQFLRLPLVNGLAFVAGMLLPSRSFLRRKYPHERHVYRRWWWHARGPREITSA